MKAAKLFLNSILLFKPHSNIDELEKYVKLLENMVAQTKELQSSEIPKILSSIKFELITSTIFSYIQQLNFPLTIVEENVKLLEKTIINKSLTPEEAYTVEKIYYILGNYYCTQHDTKKGFTAFQKGIQRNSTLCLYGLAFHKRDNKNSASYDIYEKFKNIILNKEKPSLEELYHLNELLTYYEKDEKTTKERCYQLLSSSYGKHHKYTMQLLYYFTKGAQAENSLIKQTNLKNSLIYLDKIITSCPNFLETETLVSQVICGIFGIANQSKDDELYKYSIEINNCLKKSQLQGYLKFNIQNQSIEFKK